MFERRHTCRITPTLQTRILPEAIYPQWTVRKLAILHLFPAIATVQALRPDRLETPATTLCATAKSEMPQRTIFNRTLHHLWRLLATTPEAKLADGFERGQGHWLNHPKYYAQ